MEEADTKRAAYRELVDRILTGNGKATVEERARAFRGTGLRSPLDTLVSRATSTPVQVTAADLDAAKAAGCTEDEVFELLICAVVGQSSRGYESGLAALAEATLNEGPGHAS